MREFLTREFAKIDGVLFQAMGPSPFHADFYVRCDETADLEVSKVPRSGYDRFDISVPWAIDAPDGLDMLFYQLDREFDEFYHFERQRVIQMNRWDELQQQWASLRDKLKTSVPFYRPGPRFDIHSASRNLVTDAYAFSVLHLFAKQSAVDSIRNCYGKGLPGHFEEEVTAALDDAFSEYPTQALIDWATHIHNSSFKLAEIGTLLVSALIGGMAGAALTAAITTFRAPL